MMLIDDTELEPASIFEAMIQEFPGVVDFDWDTEWSKANEPVKPWEWEWRTPLRGLLSQLTQRSDVTAWTQEAGGQLAMLLREPATVQKSLLGLYQEETGLLPIVDVTDDSVRSDDSVPVSAEGDEGPSTL